MNESHPPHGRQPKRYTIKISPSLANRNAEPDGPVPRGPIPRCHLWRTRQPDKHHRHRNAVGPNKEGSLPTATGGAGE